MYIIYKYTGCSILNNPSKYLGNKIRYEFVWFGGHRPIKTSFFIDRGVSDF